ncbi:MAG: AbrB/MazE/SpoVT family DNA-binding domain-containing protein [Pseudomonadales bacterium]
MSTATVTTKGQITIPKDIREYLDLHSKDRISFMRDDDGRVYFLPATRSLESLKGIVPKPAKPVSLDDIKATIKKRGSES